MIKFVGYLFFEEKNSSHILFAYQLKQYSDPQKTKKNRQYVEKSVASHSVRPSVNKSASVGDWWFVE